VSPPPPSPAAAPRRARGTPADPAASECPDPGTPAARRRAARALGDAELARALGTGDAAAWGEFDARFRPLLEAYARRVRVPPPLWPQCVDEVLEDEAMRLAAGAPAPDALGAYLVRASYHRFLRARRAAARRERRYGADAVDAGPGGAAGTAGAPERVVGGACSAAALRVSGGARAADGGPAGWDDPAAASAEDGSGGALAGAAAALAARLTDAERQLLVWVAEQVPRRQIAEWLGDGYEATRKRIQRLTRRLQAEALRLAAELPAAERHEFERFLRRAGHPATAAGATPGAARAGRAADPAPRAAPSRGTRP
jgi:DNA-binding CsgD family transcriptional regulator